MKWYPYGVTTFCDDIRNEVGNKISMIGCYSGDMMISAKPPVAVPILCGVVSVRLPPETDFKIFRVVATKCEGDNVAELAVAEIERQADQPTIEIPLDEATSPEDQQLSILIPMKWTSVQFDGETSIRIRGYIDGVELKLGTLKVKFAEPASDPV